MQRRRQLRMEHVNPEAASQEPSSGGGSGFDPRPWERDRARRAARRARRARSFSAGSFGPQGKLIFCFGLMVTAALGASCWMFVSTSREQLTQIGGEQARQISSLLAVTCEQDIARANTRELQLLAQDLIVSQHILFVAFLNESAKPIVLASRDLDFRLERMEFTSHETRDLMRVRRMRSPVFGQYVEVLSPVLAKTPAGGTPRGIGGGRAASPVVTGYVAVGVSQSSAMAQISRANSVVIGIGCCAILLSIPLTYLLVHRIFQPVHELVAVTKDITAGNLEARVSTHRRDVIGELARSFNDMVIWVRNQQQDIEAANAKLEEANRDLEAKVEQRTAQVETAMKRLSNEMAEKEEFLRAVSHDLNAPLRNISGMATMLLMKHKDKLDADVINRLERIKKNVDVETDLIGELLELSRIKTRRQKMEPVVLEQLVWELRGLFDNDLKSRLIDLVLDTTLPVLHAERLRIRQVFQNLIDNAIKYMGDGLTRRIHVGCTLTAAEAEFYVRDTGIGIDPEDIDKVFFVFRRGKNTATQSVAGKGVGLSSVKSIIETYGGRIWVESKLGEGTTFRFTISGKHVPAISGEPTPDPAATSAACEAGEDVDGAIDDAGDGDPAQLEQENVPAVMGAAAK